MTLIPILTSAFLLLGDLPGMLTLTDWWLACEPMGATLSPLFSLPKFSLAFIVIDVLHTFDLGCSQDALGNLFFLCIGIDQLFTGRNREIRTLALWQDIKQYYQIAKPQSRIQGLTYPMIKADKKGPKLRLKGAETRYLIPFGVDLARRLVEKRPSPLHEGVLKIFESLLAVYDSFAAEPFSPKVTANATRHFLLHYAAVRKASKADDLFWAIKPKFHLAQELGEHLTSEVGCPRSFWCYKDEDFVGFFAGVTFSRGGARSPHTTPQRGLDRWRGMCKM